MHSVVFNSSIGDLVPLKMVHDLMVLPIPMSSMLFNFRRALDYHSGVTPAQATDKIAPTAATVNINTVATATAAAAPHP